MMATEILNLAAVTIGLTVLFVLPFVPIARVVHRRARWPQILLSAMVLGTCLQAVIGLLWSHLAGSQPYMELALFVIILVSLSYWCVRYRRTTQANLVSMVEEPSPGYALLPILLALSFAVRCLHPLEVAYLGQSDAYTHLDYLHRIVENGHLLNPSYPPGYHWILALPVLVFSIDPYWVARFAGSFFGTGLVLGIFVLTEQMFNRRAAYFSAFAAACFPPMTLLMKTGVGSFANQFGLFLVPAIFYFYYRFIHDRSGSFWCAALLLLSLAGVAATVPMMLLHVIIILALHRLLDLSRFSLRWVSVTAVTFVTVIIPVGLVLFHMSSVGPGQRLQTASTLIDYSEKSIQTIRMSEAIENSADPDSSAVGGEVVNRLVSSPYYSLVVDYFSVKRAGFGNTALNTMGGVLAIQFLGFSLYGLITGNPGFLLLGLWGSVTVVQAISGFLQFSSYQREGWSLLVATCCVSGVIGNWLYEKIPGQSLPRLGAAIFVVSIILWAFISPPKHESIRSNAEDRLVRSIRFLGQSLEARTRDCAQQTRNECQLNGLLRKDLPLTLITRRFTGWRDQGEIPPNVLQRESPLQVMVVADSVPADFIASTGQYVALIDRKTELGKGKITSAFAMVTPMMVRATLKQQDKLYAANDIILDTVAGLSRDQWAINEIELAENLTAIVIIPKTTGGK